MSETKRLGRGLGALLGPISREEAESSGALRELPVSTIRPNPFQPRVHFDETALAELAASIESTGLLQPVVVRARQGGYELIAGERRWRAVQRLGWVKIPAVVKEADDRMLLTSALVENLQRDALSPIEAATSYQRLMSEFQVSQVEVARLVGKDRSTVANSLRLLRLPEEIRALVDDGRLSEGHARALLGVLDTKAMIKLALEASSSGWSVREIENRIRGHRTSTKPTSSTTRSSIPAHRRVEECLRKKLGTDVKVTPRRRGRGFLTINYYSNDDLARLLALILGHPYDG
jgi:ParB family chromosome partitioning protein